MTDVENLPAGRDLDARIATQVMGYTSGVADVQVWNTPDGQRDLGDVVGSLPHYSTDIAAAWEVVEKLGRFDLGTDTRPNRGPFYCRFKGGGAYAEAETVPLAICWAALKAATV